jgi:type I restriction enzyme S subunit
MTRTMTAMPKYESYKDSGEGWIGEIPKDWKIEKLKHLFYEKKHTSNMSLNCGSISFGEVIEKDDEKIPLSTKQSYQEVLSGEFLLNPLNLNYDLKSLRIALSKINVVVSAGYIVLKEKTDINKAYFKYLLHRFDVDYMKLMGAGVRQTINFSHIANSILILPSKNEQKAIAKFLDEKTAQIDQAIRIKEQQIALLKERKQTIIQNAVTKGLSPTSP